MKETTFDNRINLFLCWIKDNTHISGMGVHIGGQVILSRATYSKYRDITPEASRVNNIPIP